MSRPFAIMRTEDQWQRAAHERTFLDPESGGVMLGWRSARPEGAGGAVPDGAGLAFDAQCRLYHSVPEAGRIERLLWAAQSALGAAEPPAPVDVFAPSGAQVGGDFAIDPATAPAAQTPRSLAVDEDDRLLVADREARCVHVFDLWSARLLRTLHFAAAPLDLAAHGRDVFVLLDGGLAAIGARSEPRALALPAGSAPARIAAQPGTGLLFLLDAAGSPAARVVPLAPASSALAVPFATDLEFMDGTTLAVARGLDQDFRAFRLRADGSWLERDPLKARDWDGRGIVRTPDGQIGFWTERGFRHAVTARVVFERSGRVTSFRLDSGEFQTVWGRIFLDACVPEGTDVRVHCVAVDEPPESATIPHTLPGNAGALQIRRPDLSPPLLAAELAPVHVEGRLHRRTTGREQPWLQIADGDRFETYEAPILAEAGRYLWVTLELRGNTRKTPRVRCLRAEYPAHDLLRRIPKVFSRDPVAADFLRRYLAIFDGVLGEAEAKAVLRRALLDPWSAPDAMLPWLASFLGLVLDERWPEPKRRQLIEEAIALFRSRGTVAGLERFIQIYTGGRVTIVEKFRLRAATSSLLGGGALGGERAFAEYAHRFTVFIAADLDEQDVSVVEHVLETHRPAHTIFDICTVGAGMRVGRGLQVELSSVVGRTGGFSGLQVGASALGRGSLIGRPQPGTFPGSSRLGRDTRIG